MLKKLAFLTLVGAFTCLSAAAQSQNAWHKFKSEAGRFSVNIPCEPKVETENIKDGDGTVEQVYHDCSGDEGYYIVSYIDIGGPGASKTLLDKFRDGILKGANGKLISETSISIDSKPGRAIVASGRAGELDVIYNWRIYRVGKRMYSVGTVTTKDNSGSPSIAKFLLSFKLEK